MQLPVTQVTQSCVCGSHFIQFKAMWVSVAFQFLSLLERTGAFDYQFDSVTCEGFIAQVRAALALGIFSESVVLLGFCVLFPSVWSQD